MGHTERSRGQFAIGNLQFAIRNSFFFLALVFLAGAPAHAEPPKDDQDAKPVFVPFELLKSKHMAVQVKINGKGPYRLIFDTGAPFSLINTRVARDSGMVNAKARPPLLTLFNAMEPALMKTFELGDAKVENTSAAVMDHPTIETISKVLGPIEGLVGFPVFARYRMTIDYQAKQLTLVPSGYKPADGAEAVQAAALAMLQGNAPPKVLAPAGQWGFVLAKEAEDQEAGVNVSAVLPGSAAASAGLKAGDRLLVLDGRWADSVADAFHAAGFVKPGVVAKTVIKRDGKEMTLTVTPRRGL